MIQLKKSLTTKGLDPERCLISEGVIFIIWSYDFIGKVCLEVTFLLVWRHFFWNFQIKQLKRVALKTDTQFWKRVNIKATLANDKVAHISKQYLKDRSKPESIINKCTFHAGKLAVSPLPNLVRTVFPAVDQAYCLNWSFSWILHPYNIVVIIYWCNYR